ncbi:MAG: hypothetical protein L0I76_24885 [Pseudonocardia sp.]|nr:hypothetical protein [Pseudonocardia sp.]
MTSTPLTSSTHRGTPARGVPNRALWVLLIIAVVANGITSVSALPAVVGVAFGVLALVLGALLVRDHYRRRVRPGADHAPSGQSAA